MGAFLSNENSGNSKRGKMELKSPEEVSRNQVDEFPKLRKFWEKRQMGRKQFPVNKFRKFQFAPQDCSLLWNFRKIAINLSIRSLNI